MHRFSSHHLFEIISQFVHPYEAHCERRKARLTDEDRKERQYIAQ